MKKMIAILLALSLFAAMLPLSATANTTDQSEVNVIVDGAVYTAHLGDVICYTCYLDLSDIELGEGGKNGYITEFEGAVCYSGTGLRLLTPLEDDEGYPPMPKLRGGHIVVSDKPDDSVFRYNGINLRGYAFQQKKVFLQLEFEITGRSELYILNRINNMGSEEVKLYYCSEALIPPKITNEITVDRSLNIYPVGDVDMDGDVVILDASAIQLWLSSIKALSAIQLRLGDFDGDGKTTILDVTSIQRMIVGLDYPEYN